MQYLVWIIILILILVCLKRIFRASLGVIALVFFLYGGVFMLDYLTPIGSELRDYFPMAWYDKPVHHPAEVAKDAKSKGSVWGGATVNKVNKAGDQVNNKIAGMMSKPKKKKAVSQAYKVKKQELQARHSYKCDTAGKKQLLADYNGYLTKKDRELVRGVTPLLRTDLTGDHLILKVSKGNLVVHLKAHQ